MVFLGMGSLKASDWNGRLWIIAVVGVIMLSPTLLDTGVVHASNKEGWKRRLRGNGLLYIHSPIRCVFGHQSEKHIEVAITPNKYQPHSSAYLGILHLFNFVPWPALGR